MPNTLNLSTEATHLKHCQAFSVGIHTLMNDYAEESTLFTPPLAGRHPLHLCASGLRPE